MHYPAVKALTYLASALDYTVCALDGYDDVPPELQEAVDDAAEAVSAAHLAVTLAVASERMVGG